MSQHDMSLANDTGANLRADANLALVALASQSSGATAPATMYSYQVWADSTTGIIKRRNAANGGWLLDRTLAETRVLGKAANYTVVAADFQTWIACSGTFTLTLTAAATMGDGWHCGVRNNSTGVITIDPNGAEQIDGGTTLKLYPGESCEIICTGSTWVTQGLTQAVVKVLQTSRDVSLTSLWTVSGVGFKPRHVWILGAIGGNNGSWGFSDGTTHGCMFFKTAMYVRATELLVIGDYGVNHNSISAVTFGDDGADFTWAKTGSPTGTADIMFTFGR